MIDQLIDLNKRSVSNFIEYKYSEAKKDPKWNKAFDVVKNLVVCKPDEQFVNDTLEKFKYKHKIPAILNITLQMEMLKLMNPEYGRVLDLVYKKINLEEQTKEFGEFIKNEEEIMKQRKLDTNTFTIQEMVDSVNNSTLDIQLKDALLDRLENGKIEDLRVKEYAICDLHSCLGFMRKYNIPFDTYDEEAEADVKIRKHFEENLLDFPIVIVTEQGFVLFKPKKDESK